MKLSIVGAGNMAKAIIKALLNSEITIAANITVSDINEEALAKLSTTFNVNTVANNLAVISSADTVILAIKPQNLDDISREISDMFTPEQLVISILAGTPIDRLADKLKHDKIIRAMPNTPAQIGQGMTVWTASNLVSPEQKQQAEEILSSMGKTLYVNDEKYLDMATAISGSGPAYFFMFMEYLVNSAIKLGFDAEAARDLVLQTALGSIQYALSSKVSLEELRRQVTSPGGTTAEAIASFNNNNIEEIINEAVIAAYQKAIGMSTN